MPSKVTYTCKTCDKVYKNWANHKNHAIKEDHDLEAKVDAPWLEQNDE